MAVYAQVLRARATQIEGIEGKDEYWRIVNMWLSGSVGSLKNMYIRHKTTEMA